MSNHDPCKVPGNKVWAKACHVTSLAECARRYGGYKHVKLLQGTVYCCEYVRNPVTNRSSTFVVADYDLGGGSIKRARINIRSIKISYLEIQMLGNGVQEIQQETQVQENTDAQDTDGQQTTTMTNETSTNQITTNPTMNNETTTTPSQRPIVHSEIIQPSNIDMSNVYQDRSNEVSTSDGVDSPESTAPSQNKVQVHGVTWLEDDNLCKIPVNGIPTYRQWKLRLPSGNTLGERSDVQNMYSRLDYFLYMFPPDELLCISQLTNSELSLKAKTETTCGEILKFFGVLILTTKFEFGSRASLWSNTANFKYIPALSFGITGMSRQRFDDLWQCIRWSKQPRERPSHMSSEKYRWQLVDDFIESFNRHRSTTFLPSDLICVDESISRWYGQGGHWINMGLPMYIAIDRKPEFGCEIQNAACGRSGVMIRLKLVKSSREEATLNEDNEIEGNQNLNHGTKVLKSLVEPWIRSDRIVCADSYFASVNAVEELTNMGLRFIGVVKNATKKFPMSFLSTYELQTRGDWKGLVTKNEDGNPSMIAFVWMDRERRYFITNTSCLLSGAPYIRQRWRQIGDDENGDPTLVELSIPQPAAAEIYYTAVAKIDRHNRCRQDNLQLEQKLQTQKWGTRVNLTIFSMIVVDTWLVYSSCTGVNKGEKQCDFYAYLAEELIDNNYDTWGHARRRQQGSGGMVNDESPTLSRVTGLPRSGVAAHLTPTKRRRRKSDGSLTIHRLQGRCMICQLKTTYLCSSCNDDHEVNLTTGRTPWLCHTEKGRTCFAQHYELVHSSNTE